MGTRATFHHISKLNFSEVLLYKNVSLIATLSWMLRGPCKSVGESSELLQNKKKKKRLFLKHEKLEI